MDVGRRRGEKRELQKVVLSHQDEIFLTDANSVFVNDRRMYLYKNTSFRILVGTWCQDLSWEDLPKVGSEVFPSAPEVLRRPGY
jgi:hypothetical protein